MSTKYPAIPNITPAVWGPHAWKFMHYVALTYPERPTDDEKRSALQFFKSLEHLLPCASCKTNYRSEIKQFPIELAVNSHQDLNAWLGELHNSVSSRLNKPRMNVHQLMDYLFHDKETKSRLESGASEGSGSGSGAASGSSPGSSPQTWYVILLSVSTVAFIVAFAIYYSRWKKLKKA